MSNLSSSEMGTITTFKKRYMDANIFTITHIHKLGVTLNYGNSATQADNTEAVM